MIYPFTRTVIYGAIWYQGKELAFHLLSIPFVLNSMDKGEANRDYNTDKYACSFSKMIYYWRQIWNQRTNGISGYSNFHLVLFK